MGHLKGCIQEFLDLYFEKSDLPVRFRLRFFRCRTPAEVDIGCFVKMESWSWEQETIGLKFWGGMVHPNVLKACHLDPEEYQGFALVWDWSELHTQIRHPRSRAFFESDVQWLKHYGFRPRSSNPMRGTEPVKFTLSWLREHLETTLTVDEQESPDTSWPRG